MRNSYSTLGFALALSCQLLPIATLANAAIIERDVLIIGGGAAGTYIATRLQQLGKSVALIERNDHLGGHTNTYVDPASGATFDYGVIAFSDLPVVRNFCDYLNVPLAPFQGFVPNATTIYADFATGAEANVPPQGTGSIEADAIARDPQLAAYASFLTLGTGYNLPDPVPEELLLPWGQFLAKYNLSSEVYQPFFLSAANTLQQLALYMLRYYSPLTIPAAQVTTANHDNQGIFDSALAKLGPTTSVFLNSNIIHILRTSAGVVAVVNTPSGLQTFKTRQLVMAIPPQNLAPTLDLRQQEATLFQQFQNIYVWDGIVANSGFPYNLGIDNVNPLTQTLWPQLPATLTITQSGIVDVDVHAIYYGSTTPMSDSDVQRNMLEDVDTLQQNLTYPGIDKSQTPEIVQFFSHNPYFLTVSADAIRNGFYNKVNALQGKYRTWWTGAAWDSENTAGIWNFTEYHVLPGVLAALG